MIHILTSVCVCVDIVKSHVFEMGWTLLDRSNGTELYCVRYLWFLQAYVSINVASMYTMQPGIAVTYTFDFCLNVPF